MSASEGSPTLKDERPRWEKVRTDEAARGITALHRLRVANGWLYRTIVDDKEYRTTAVATSFVPDKFHDDQGD